VGFGDDVDISQFVSLDFNPSELDALIVRNGAPCEYRKAVPCPCVRIETRRGTIACKHCHGLGHLYPTQLRSRLTVLASSRSDRGESTQAGLITEGTAQVTFPTGYLPANGDVLVPDCEPQVVQESLIRAELQVDPHTLPAGPWTVPTTPRPYVDRILYDEVQIECLFWLDGDTLCEGVEGLDYTLRALETATEVVWRDGRGPAAGTAYSVRYQARTAYMVRLEEGAFRGQADRVLPRRVTVKRLDKLAERDLR